MFTEPKNVQLKNRLLSNPPPTTTTTTINTNTHTHRISQLLCLCDFTSCCPECCWNVCESLLFLVASYVQWNSSILSCISQHFCEANHRIGRENDVLSRAIKSEWPALSGSGRADCVLAEVIISHFKWKLSFCISLWHAHWFQRLSDVQQGIVGECASLPMATGY